MPSRKSFVAAAVSLLALAGLPPAGAWGAALRHAPRPLASFGAPTSPYPSLASCRQTVQHETYTRGVLTVPTDDPVYEPWFVNNTPSNGKGYEPAVAYEVGSLLGFDHANVKWVTEAFDSSYAPGPKRFDFDINEVSVTPDRAKVVSFSISYYATTQSIVALTSDAIVKHHSPAELKTYLYADQIGTTGSRTFTPRSIRHVSRVSITPWTKPWLRFRPNRSTLLSWTLRTVSTWPPLR